MPGERLIYTSCRFGGPGLEAWREELGGDIEFRLAQVDFEFLRKKERGLFEIVQRRPAGYEWRIHEILTQMLGRLLKERGIFNSALADTPPPLTRAINLLTSDPSRDWKVTELAQTTGVSETSLRRLFKDFQHESIHEFLQRSRVDQARQLLCDKRLSVKEIAMRLNFSSEFYFSRFFKKHTGVSPRHFREVEH
jgi:AraC-like DNA-binding protein